MHDYITYTGKVEVPRSEYTPDTIAARLTDLFGPQCGLNAEWSVRAWHILGHRPNHGTGAYLLDQEDGTWELTWRRFYDGDDWLATLEAFTDTGLLALLSGDAKSAITTAARDAVADFFRL